MNYNLSTWYGLAQASNAPFTTGKIFVVTASWWANTNNIDGLYRPDSEWIARKFANITDALAACVTWRWDVVILASDYTTWITAAELLSAETKWVVITQWGKNYNWRYVAYKTTASLPANTQWVLFTVTWRIKLLSIIWEVTTIIQTQACNTKIVANPTVWADVDMCAVLDTTASAVGSQFSITWTLANAMVKTTSWTWVFQAAPLLVMPWSIDLNTAATNTWSVKWMIQYESIDPWAICY